MRPEKYAKTSITKLGQRGKLWQKTSWKKNFSGMGWMGLGGTDPYGAKNTLSLGIAQMTFPNSVVLWFRHQKQNLSSLNDATRVAGFWGLQKKRRAFVEWTFANLCVKNIFLYGNGHFLLLWGGAAVETETLLSEGSFIGKRWFNNFHNNSYLSPLKIWRKI